MRSRPVALIVLAGLLAAPAPPQQSRAQERTIAALPQSLEGTLFAQIPRDCAGVMLTAVRWNAEQTTIWCQDKDDAKEMLYTTEQYVRAVVAGRPVHKDSLLGEIPPETGWKKLERDWAVKTATHAIVQIVLVGDGEIWIDDVMIAVLE